MSSKLQWDIERVPGDGPIRFRLNRIRPKPEVEKLRPLTDRFPGQGQVRLGAAVPLDEIAVPYAWSSWDKVGDHISFLDPADPQWTGYLPHYSVATDGVAPNDRVLISLSRAADGGGRLTVVLRKARANNGAIPATAEEISHELKVELRYHIDGRTKQHIFNERQTLTDGVRCSLRIDSEEELIEIDAAMNNVAFDPQLRIERTLIVATPLDDAFSTSQFDNPAFDATSVPVRLAVTNRNSLAEAGGGWTRYDLAVTNSHSFPESSFAARDDLPPIGLDSAAPRTLVELHGPDGTKQYGFAGIRDREHLRSIWIVRQAPGRPAATEDRRLRAVLHDRLTSKRFVSDWIDPHADELRSSAPQFVARSDPFEQTVDFSYSRSLHGYIYPDSNPDGVTRHHVSYDGETYVYLQRNSQRNLFYFCPDRFKLIRRSGSPSTPELTTRFVDTGGGISALEAQVTYRVAAEMDPGRLQAAAAHFEARGSMLDNLDAPIFESLAASRDSMQYRLRLPVDGVITVVPRTDFSITGPTLDDVLPPMPLDDFLLVFDKLVDPARQSPMLTGDISCSLAGEHVGDAPVVLALHDGVGPVFATDTAATVGETELTVGLTNIIESPVRLTGMPTIVLSNPADDPMAVEVEQPLGQLPTLDPGQRIAYKGAVSTPITAGAGPAEVDQPHVVEADPAALFDAILDPNVPSVYAKAISILGFASLFASDAGSDLSVIEVRVSNADGGTTNDRELAVHRDDPDRRYSVSISRPIRDYILSGGADEGFYWVQVTTVDNDGIPNSGPWHRRSDEVLVLTRSLMPTVGDGGSIQ